MKRAGLAATVVVAIPLACGGKEPIVVREPERPVTLDVPRIDAGVEEAGRAPDVGALLAPFAVSNKKPARGVLFTWTTREQADELARDKVLLTRTKSPEKGASFYDQVLARNAHKLAGVLKSKAFARARFAWTSPWPTLLGWPGETYGDILIGVKLKPEALIVTLRASKSAIMEVSDIEGKAVPLDRAVAHPELIAAVYFVNDNPGLARRGSFMGSFEGVDTRQGFREYVLCNESMIEEWSIGSTRESEAVDRSIEALDAMSGVVRDTPFDEDATTWNRRVARGWDPVVPATAKPVVLYEASMAIPSENYLPTPEKIRELRKQLARVMPSPIALTHKPRAVFPIDRKP